MELVLINQSVYHISKTLSFLRFSVVFFRLTNVEEEGLILFVLLESYIVFSSMSANHVALHTV